MYEILLNNFKRAIDSKNGDELSPEDAINALEVYCINNRTPNAAQLFCEAFQYATEKDHHLAQNELLDSMLCMGEAACVIFIEKLIELGDYEATAILLDRYPHIMNTALSKLDNNKNDEYLELNDVERLRNSLHELEDFGKKIGCPQEAINQFLEATKERLLDKAFELGDRVIDCTRWLRTNTKVPIYTRTWTIYSNYPGHHYASQWKKYKELYFQAAKRGYHQTLLLIPFNGVNEGCDEYSQTCEFTPFYSAIHYAVRYGHLAVVRNLLKQGACYNNEEVRYKRSTASPLELAETYHHTEVANLLIALKFVADAAGRVLIKDIQNPKDISNEYLAEAMDHHLFHTKNPEPLSNFLYFISHAKINEDQRKRLQILTGDKLYKANDQRAIVFINQYPEAFPDRLRICIKGLSEPQLKDEDNKALINAKIQFMAVRFTSKFLDLNNKAILPIYAGLTSEMSRSYFLTFIKEAVESDVKHVAPFHQIKLGELEPLSLLEKTMCIFGVFDNVNIMDCMRFGLYQLQELMTLCLKQKKRVTPVEIVIKNSEPHPVVSSATSSTSLNTTKMVGVPDEYFARVLTTTYDGIHPPDDVDVRPPIGEPPFNANATQSADTMHSFFAPAAPDQLNALLGISVPDEALRRGASRSGNQDDDNEDYELAAESGRKAMTS